MLTTRPARVNGYLHLLKYLLFIFLHISLTYSTSGQGGGIVILYFEIIKAQVKYVELALRYVLTKS